MSKPFPDTLSLTLWKEFWVAPDNPSNTRIDQTILVARNVDGNDLFKSEVPDQIWINERSHEATRCSVNVNRAVNATLNEQVIDGLRVLIFASVGCSQNRANT